jgi:hypothetical protein
MKVKAKIKLLEHQLELLHCTAQYPALVAGYGAGKTESGIYRTLHYIKTFGLLFKEHNMGEYVFGIYEPTYDLIKVILFPRFETILTNLKIDYSLNKTDKILIIPKFNAKIIFRSLDNDDKIIGYEHADFWIDELDTLKKDKAKSVFEKITARNRLLKPFNALNTGFITTTPEGFKFVYEKWAKAKDKEKFKIIKGKTKNNVFLPSTYVDDLLEQYPENLILAYLEGEFVNLNASNVYVNFKRNECKTNLTIEKYFKDKEQERKLYIGMDFNVEHMAAVVAIHNEEDNELYIVEELKEIFDTPSMIEILKENYNGFELYLCTDAAGHQRKSVNASSSDIQLLKSAGFNVLSDKSNPLIKDRVLSVNSLFRNGKGIRRLFINTDKCKTLTENLEQQTYDEKTGQPDKKSGHDHIIDALGYLVNKLYPVRRQLFIE